MQTFVNTMTVTMNIYQKDIASTTSHFINHPQYSSNIQIRTPFGVWDDVGFDEETHSLVYRSDDKAVITKIVDEFKYFFGVN